MTDQLSSRTVDEPKRPGLSIRVAVLLAVNTTLLFGLAALLGVDYQRGLTERMEAKQAALAEEAALILPAVELLEHHGLQRVQDYIDRACAKMQDTVSPGHHIAVRLSDTILQARTHHRASPTFVNAMQAGAAAPDHRSQVDGLPILVGAHTQGPTQVYVSEFTTNVLRSARNRLMARAGGILLIGLVITALVNLFLVRLVTRPIDRLVDTVRQIGNGELGTTPPRFATRELGFLAGEIGAMSQSLAVADRARRQEMDKARRIQRNLLPRPDRLEAAGIHHAYLPAEEVGGDFFDVKNLGEHRTAVYVGDVTGHGVPAALSAAMLKVLFRHASAPLDAPAAVLDEINRRFHAVTLDGDFASMFMGVIDHENHRMIYASAGHEIGYVVSAEGGVRELTTTGLLLGVDPEARCEVEQIGLAPGDMVVLLTDGLAETMSPNARLLGRDPIKSALATPPVGSPQQVTETLLRLADAHRQDGPQLDDITLVVARVCGASDNIVNRSKP